MLFCWPVPRVEMREKDFFLRSAAKATPGAGWVLAEAGPTIGEFGLGKRAPC